MRISFAAVSGNTKLVRIARVGVSEGKMPDNRRVPGPEESQDPITFLKSSERREKAELVCNNE